MQRVGRRRDGGIAVPAGAKTDLREWGTVFCTETVQWLEGAVEGAQDFEARAASMTTDQAKAALVGFFITGVEATQAYADAVEAAGIPAVQNGARIQATILEGIGGARDVLEELADQAAQLPTTDANAFRAAAQQITSRMDDVSAPFEEAMNKASRLDRSKKLDKSLRKLRACKPLL